jgi:hypothetical protein
MSYCCQTKSGILKVETEENSKKVIEILETIDINYDYDKALCLIDIYKSTLFRYDERAFDEIATLVTDGSYIRFMGEDDTVWTLTFSDGIVIDNTGEILWDHSEFKPNESQIEEALNEITGIFGDCIPCKNTVDSNVLKQKIRTTLVSFGLIKGDEAQERCRNCICLVTDQKDRFKWVCDDFGKEIHEVPDDVCHY